MRILLASASERRGAILSERFSNLEQKAINDVDESVPRDAISEQVRQVVSRKAVAGQLDARMGGWGTSTCLLIEC